MNKKDSPQAVNNSVQLQTDGTIRLNYVGAQTRDTLRVLTKQLLSLMAQQRHANKPVLVIADMRKITKTDSSARIEAKWFLEEADYDALAIVGNRYLQPLIFFVLRDYKGSKAVKYFTNEASARRWLQNPSPDANFNRLKPKSHLKWALIPLLILIIFGTIGSWQQTQRRIDAEAEKQFAAETLKHTQAINSRLRAYTDALLGFRGLFHSSEQVTEQEYHDYLAALDLAKNYPGVNSINFVTRVPSAEVPAFIDRIKADTSRDPKGNSDFKLTLPGKLNEHFVVTYVGVHGAGSGKGLDLSSNDERRATLETARLSGQPTATDTVRLFDAQGNERVEKGFLVTIPIYGSVVPKTEPERLQQGEGFVNAVFDYSKLFQHTFGGISAADVAVRVLDPHGAVVYEQGRASDDMRHVSTKFSIGGKSWTLEVLAPQLFGVSRVERALPYYVASLGITLSVLLTVVLWTQHRGRQRAIELASSMTEDIKQERNNAVVASRRDEAILTSIGDGVLVLDAQGTIEMFNKAAELISGVPAAEAVGKPYRKVLDFINARDGTVVDGFVTGALDGHSGEMARDTFLRRKDGTLVPVADSAAPIADAHDTAHGAVIVFRDITREKQLERMKDEFLSVASHELRTPMGAIRANLSMILAGDYGPVSPEIIEPLTDMKTSTVRLVELVNDLLNVARIEAGRMKFILKEFDLQSIMQSTVKSLAPLGKEKGIAITITSTGTAQVQADPDKVSQVLTNLIGNALKFTDTGRITVSVQLSDGDLVEVAVSDTGVGISAADQAKLFGKFKQIYTQQDGKPTGTGLGLYISREIIRKMGGELWIKNSATGHGSTFAFTLPRVNSLIAQKARQDLEQEATLHPDQK